MAKIIRFGKEFLTIKEIALKLNITPEGLRKRLLSGWKIELGELVPPERAENSKRIDIQASRRLTLELQEGFAWDEVGILL